MIDKEVWRAIKSLPGLLASSHGRIMVSPRFASMPYGGERQYGGEPTHGQWDGTRYVYVFKGKTYKVSRIVCEAFNGPPPFSEAVCMHLDEDARNNTHSNLAWGTQKENLNAPRFIAYCKSRVGARNPYIKGLQKCSIEECANGMG